MERVGIIGGTFNPIHHAHLFLAAQAEHHFQLRRILFLPNRHPPHKPPPAVSADHRLAMLKMALEGRPNWEISRVEMDSQQVSYTVETLSRLPSGPAYHFITGADALQVPWKNLDGVLAQLECLVAATRPGFPLEELAAHLDSLELEHRHRVHFMQMPALGISSSEIRQRLNQGLPVSYLLPTKVEKYILKRRLYSTEPSE